MIDRKMVLIKSGLIAGSIFALSWVIFHLLFADNQESDWGTGEALGYLTMLIALSAVYFGVRNYRDHQLAGVISFKEAFLNGMVVVLIASVIYVISWMVYSSNFMPDFADQYAAEQIKSLNEAGFSQDELQAKIKEVEDFNESYKNPIVMAGITFLEIFPVGLVIAVISALLLKRR